MIDDDEEKILVRYCSMKFFWIDVIVDVNSDAMNPPSDRYHTKKSCRRR
jgi:hypothetical protein